MAGQSVAVEHTLADCEAFLAGRYDNMPEDQCYMKGRMEGAAP